MGFRGEPPTGGPTVPWFHLSSFPRMPGRRWCLEPPIPTHDLNDLFSFSNN